MNFLIYKLEFNTPVHFGNGNLDDTDIIFRSDRLFSALMIEMLKINGTEGIDKLLSYVKNNHLLISDSLPYVGDEYFLPKPFVYINKEHNQSDNNSVNKKVIKKMKYIPIVDFEKYINGIFNNAESTNEKINHIGSKNYDTKVNIGEIMPYQVTSFSFSKNAGLYFLIKYDDEDINNVFTELLLNLSLTGIGGEKSTGFGKFDCKVLDTDNDVYRIYDKYINNNGRIKMTISSCLPKNDEIEKALNNASYNIIRNGGFVSNHYKDIKYIKKKSFYYINSGACFENEFEGDVYNVSFDEDHPVYRYAKPFFVSAG